MPDIRNCKHFRQIIFSLKCLNRLNALEISNIKGKKIFVFTGGNKKFASL